MRGRSLSAAGVALLLAGAALVAVGTVATSAVGPFGAASGRPLAGPASPGGYGMMGGGYGMMGGGYGVGPGGSGPLPGARPGEAGFVPGTASAPRIVTIIALPTERFWPATVEVQAGETITFEVTTMGPLTHEFMVGPAVDVAADRDGTPEIADIGMMQTKAITYTFSGPGPFAFACHAPGHDEAGMSGTIVVR
jgi:plastocyanin